MSDRLNGERRVAIIVGGLTDDLQQNMERVDAYLPNNYDITSVDMTTGGTVLVIVGRDVAGWTMDGYVIPRLESGLIFAREVI